MAVRVYVVDVEGEPVIYITNEENRVLYQEGSNYSGVSLGPSEHLVDPTFELSSRPLAVGEKVSIVCDEGRNFEPHSHSERIITSYLELEKQDYKTILATQAARMSEYNSAIDDIKKECDEGIRQLKGVRDAKMHAVERPNIRKSLEKLFNQSD